TGTADQLKDAIHGVVTDIYCEFNVQVISIMSPIAPGGTQRRNTVGIGTDRVVNRGCDNPLFGQSTRAGGDPGDSLAVDFARIFAGYFNCADITLDNGNWANAIGSTAAHEAAHNYGQSHADGDETARRREDDWTHHLMKEGRDYKYEHRAKRRH